MSGSPGYASNLYCPGCTPGDFAQPHICGVSGRLVNDLSMNWCARCNVNWTGGHVCWQPSWVGTTTTMPTIKTSTGASACDHCFCLKQKAGWYDIQDPTSTYGYTQRHHLKPHQICCNCGNRQVKEGARP